MADRSTLDISSPFRTLFSYLKKPDALPEFDVSPSIRRKERAKIVANSPEAMRCRALLALTANLQTDGIITESTELLDCRYSLYQFHRVPVIPVSEFADLLEICAHGHSVFWSTSYEDRYLTHDVFYQWTHWKNARLAKWFDKTKPTISNPKLHESLRSAILNRYSLLAYARDMALFYNLQSDFYFRRRLVERFTIPLAYHFASFYMLLWGMLDHITIVAKYAKGLQVTERRCGIRSKQFWEEFAKIHPELKKFVARREVSSWLRAMADMRHTTAHGKIAIPTNVLSDTPDSKKSDEEIQGILREEKAFMYQTLSPDAIKAFEPMWIQLWRVKHMKLMAPDMVPLARDEQTYLRAGCLSIDHDLQFVNAIIDAFFVSLFTDGRGPAGQNVTDE
jgi:hypothetical protein